MEFAHRTVRFCGRGTTGPFTWAQHQIWREIQLMSANPAFGNQTQGVEVPAGVTVDDVVGQLGVLVSRYEALRTLCYLDDDGLGVQEVIAEDELRVDLVIASEHDDALMAVAADQETRLLTTPFDHGADLPFRAVVGVVDGVPRLVLIAASHLAADYLSGRILVRELLALLTASAAGEPPPAAPAARQPIEQAEYERTGRGDRLLTRALRHWRTELLQAPESMFPGPTAAAADPRYWRGAIRSRAVPLALDLLADRYKVSTSVVLLATTSALLGRSSGLPRCTLRIVVGNRVAPALRDAVGSLTQEVPATIDLSGKSVEDVVRSTWSGTLRAFRNGQFQPEAAAELLDSLGRERGAAIDLSVCFNDLWSPGHRPGPSRSPEEIDVVSDDTVFAWEDRIARAGVSFFLEATDVIGDPDLIRLSLLTDTTRIPPSRTESFLLTLERLLITLSEREVGLHELDSML